MELSITVHLMVIQCPVSFFSVPSPDPSLCLDLSIKDFLKRELIVPSLIGTSLLLDINVIMMQTKPPAPTSQRPTSFLFLFYVGNDTQYSIRDDQKKSLEVII